MTRQLATTTALLLALTLTAGAGLTFTRVNDSSLWLVSAVAEPLAGIPEGDLQDFGESAAPAPRSNRHSRRVRP